MMCLRFQLVMTGLQKLCVSIAKVRHARWQTNCVLLLEYAAYTCIVLWQTAQELTGVHHKADF